MTFADRLKELRIEKNLSMEDVGQRIGVSRANIYKYEHGIVTNIPPDKIHALAELFGVTRPYLMGWTDKRDVDPVMNLDTVAEKLRVPDGEIVAENDTTYWRATGQKQVDCVTAATQAVRAMIKFNIARTPIYPQRIMQESQYCTVITFGHQGELDQIMLGTDVLSSRTEGNLVMTSTFVDKDGHDHYLFAVNRNAPMGKLKLTLAVEIGHIYLGHVGHLRDKSRKDQEAECFAMHLIFPRPLIKLLRERGYVLTMERFSRIFGDCEWCLDSLLNAHPVRVTPELNRIVKEQFTPYVDMLEEIGVLKIPREYDKSEVLDLSRYMAGYED